MSYINIADKILQSQKHKPIQEEIKSRLKLGNACYH
jgi:hypothetical protein